MIASGLLRLQRSAHIPSDLYATTLLRVLRVQKLSGWKPRHLDKCLWVHASVAAALLPADSSIDSSRMKIINWAINFPLDQTFSLKCSRGVYQSLLAQVHSVSFFVRADKRWTNGLCPDVQA